MTSGGSILSAAATEGVLHIALTLNVALFVAALFAVFALHVAEVPGEGEVDRAGSALLRNMQNLF